MLVRCADWLLSDILRSHPIVKFDLLCLVAALSAIAACGGANAGPLIPAGEGGAGGAPPTGQGVFRLNCEFETEELNLPIELLVELFVELTEPFSRTDSTEATFSASVTLDKESVASLIEALIDAGLPTMIDIAAASVTTNLTGANPETMTASLVGTPILRFDLQADPDDDGLPGPHRFDFDPVSVTANATSEATEVFFGLDFGGISLSLGNFNVPADCDDSSLGGVALRFPVGR